MRRQQAGLLTAIRKAKPMRNTRCGPSEGKGNRTGIEQTHRIVYQARDSQTDSSCSKLTVGRPCICLYLPQCHFPDKGFTGLASVSPSPTSDDFCCAKAPQGEASVSTQGRRLMLGEPGKASLSLGPAQATDDPQAHINKKESRQGERGVPKERFILRTCGSAYMVDLPFGKC